MTYGEFFKAIEDGVDSIVWKYTPDAEYHA